jgi:PIN domain nuclease of toxin-antitoxin system
MRLLVDTTFLIDLSRDELGRRSQQITSELLSPANICFASVASLWEVAIKFRLGRLDLTRPLEDFPIYLRRVGFNFLSIDFRHALTSVVPEPPTRDPFDRLLLAPCAVENLRLVTLDRALVDHPLAWRPA